MIILSQKIKVCIQKNLLALQFYSVPLPPGVNQRHEANYRYNDIKNKLQIFKQQASETQEFRCLIESSNADTKRNIHQTKSKDFTMLLWVKLLWFIARATKCNAVNLNLQLTDEKGSNILFRNDFLSYQTCNSKQALHCNILNFHLKFQDFIANINHYNEAKVLSVPLQLL